MSLNPTAPLLREPLFWRDDNLPFIEARTIADGRKVCYTRHSTNTFPLARSLPGKACISMARTISRSAPAPWY